MMRHDAKQELLGMIQGAIIVLIILVIVQLARGCHHVAVGVGL